MKKITLFFVWIGLSIPSLLAQSEDCASCNILFCDGYTCDDNTNGDGVQTSRKCSCGEIIDGACAKVEIDLSQHPLYNPANPSGLKFTTQESGNFSIFFTDENCTVADCLSPDIVVSSDANFELPPGDSIYMVVCKNGGNAGRRDMMFEYFPVQSTESGFCEDGFDNDLDGNTDCDDPDCNTFCTSPSSGNGGGTESNGRLAGQIGYRNFDLLKKGALLFEPVFPTEINMEQLAFSRNVDGLGAFDDYLPTEALSKLFVTEATPSGLVGVTNASEVFAVDAEDSNGRVGTILLLKTEEAVYEHTKPICDRLLGNVLEKIYKKNFGTDTLIVYKITEKGRAPEYCVSISARLDENGGVILENHWTLDRYPEAEYMNIQIWTSTEDRLEQWLTEMMAKLKAIYPQVTLNSSVIPTSFVRRGWMENGQLKIEVSSKENSGPIALSGYYSRAELEEETYSYFTTFSMDSLAVLHRSIDISDFFDLGLHLEDDQGIGDDVYFADGQWGLDDSHPATFVSDFHIRPQEIASTSGFPLRRAVSLQGYYEDYVSVYRALHPRFKALDLSDYNNMTFTTSGEGTLEITLVKESILDWDTHYRASVLLSEVPTTYELPFSQFKSAGFSQALDPQDLVMVVFSLRSPNGEQQNLQFDLGNLSFENKLIQQYHEFEMQDLRSYPNPFSGFLEIQFSNIYEEPYEILISNIQGQVIFHKEGRTIAGINEARLETSDYAEGIYVVQVRMLKGGLRVGKVYCQPFN